MRHLRKFCVAVVLTCALAFSVHAGEISCPGIASTPPDSRVMTDGQIECGITKAALIIIQSVLSLT